jgi:hypothetical protein
MMILVRLVALIIGLLSLYMTHLCFKRKTFNRIEFLAWGSAWFGLIVLSLAPQLAYSSIKLLDIFAVSDFIYVVSLIVLFVVCFKLYIATKEAHQKIEALVRKVAIDEAMGAPRKS